MKYNITFEQFLECLQQVETHGCNHKGESAVGDGGLAVGPLQIHECNYDDAISFLFSLTPAMKWKCDLEDLKIKLNYDCCNYWTFSCIIAHLYFRRHAQKALLEGDWEKLARIWNGGPTGYRKKATIPYWEKVKIQIERIANNG